MQGGDGEDCDEDYGPLWNHRNGRIEKIGKREGRIEEWTWEEHKKCSAERAQAVHEANAQQERKRLEERTGFAGITTRHPWVD